MDETKNYKVLETIVLNDMEVAVDSEVELTEEQAAEFAGKVEEIVSEE